MPLDAAMPIPVVLHAGALLGAPHVSHVDVRDLVRLDVEMVAFVVLLADMLLDALFVQLEGVRGAMLLVTVPSDVVTLIRFAVLAIVLIEFICVCNFANMNNHVAHDFGVQFRRHA